MWGQVAVLVFGHFDLVIVIPLLIDSLSSLNILLTRQILSNIVNTKLIRFRSSCQVCADSHIVVIGLLRSNLDTLIIL